MLQILHTILQRSEDQDQDELSKLFLPDYGSSRADTIDEMISQLGIELPELQPSHSSSSTDSKTNSKSIPKKGGANRKTKDQIPIDPILLTPPTTKSTTRSRTQAKSKTDASISIPNKKKKSGRTKVETVIESPKSKAKTNKTGTKTLIKKNEPESTPLKSIEEVTVPKIEKKFRKVVKRKL